MAENQEHWQELVEFAQESGFEAKYMKTTMYLNPNKTAMNCVVTETILLPLGQISNVEYGVCINKRQSDPMAYILQNKELETGQSIECYTPTMVIRTAKFKDKEYVIEKEKKENINDLRGLIWAFKCKDQGTIDQTFLAIAYTHITKLMPHDVAKQLIDYKISELEEKLEEADAAGPKLPERDKILRNILAEFAVYAGPAQELEIEIKLEKYEEIVFNKLTELEEKLNELIDSDASDSDVESLRQDISIYLTVARIIKPELAEKIMSAKTFDAYYILQKKHSDNGN